MTATEHEAREGYRRGEPRVIALPGDTGAAGLRYDFPGVETFRLESLAFAVTTAGGGGARQVVAQLEDSTGAPVFVNAAPGTQAGGLTVVYSFAPMTVAFGSGAAGFMGAAFVGGRLPGNMSISIQVVSASPGDLIFNARVLVCQYDYVQPRG